MQVEQEEASYYEPFKVIPEDIWLREILKQCKFAPWELFQFRFASKHSLKLFEYWVNDTSCRPRLPCLMCRKLRAEGDWPPPFELNRPFIRSTSSQHNFLLVEYDLRAEENVLVSHMRMATRHRHESVVQACHDCCDQYLGDHPSEVSEVLLTVCRKDPCQLYPLLAYAQARSLFNVWGTTDLEADRYERVATPSNYNCSSFLGERWGLNEALLKDQIPAFSDCYPNFFTNDTGTRVANKLNLCMGHADPTEEEFMLYPALYAADNVMGLTLTQDWAAYYPYEEPVKWDTKGRYVHDFSAPNCELEIPEVAPDHHLEVVINPQNPMVSFCRSWCGSVANSRNQRVLLPRKVLHEKSKCSRGTDAFWARYGLPYCAAGPSCPVCSYLSSDPGAGDLKDTYLLMPRSPLAFFPSATGRLDWGADHGIFPVDLENAFDQGLYRMPDDRDPETPWCRLLNLKAYSYLNKVSWLVYFLNCEFWAQYHLEENPVIPVIPGVDPALIRQDMDLTYSGWYGKLTEHAHSCVSAAYHNVWTNSFSPYTNKDSYFPEAVHTPREAPAPEQCFLLMHHRAAFYENYHTVETLHRLYLGKATAPRENNVEWDTFELLLEKFPFAEYDLVGSLNGSGNYENKYKTPLKMTGPHLPLKESSVRKLVRASLNPICVWGTGVSYGQVFSGPAPVDNREWDDLYLSFAVGKGQRETWASSFGLHEGRGYAFFPFEDSWNTLGHDMCRNKAWTGERSPLACLETDYENNSMWRLFAVRCRATTDCFVGLTSSGPCYEGLLHKESLLVSHLDYLNVASVLAKPLIRCQTLSCQRGLSNSDVVVLNSNWDCLWHSSLRDCGLYHLQKLPNGMTLAFRNFCSVFFQEEIRCNRCHSSRNHSHFRDGAVDTALLQMIRPISNNSKDDFIFHGSHCISTLSLATIQAWNRFLSETKEYLGNSAWTTQSDKVVSFWHGSSSSPLGNFGARVHTPDQIQPPYTRVLNVFPYLPTNQIGVVPTSYNPLKVAFYAYYMGSCIQGQRPRFNLRYNFTNAILDSTLTSPLVYAPIDNVGDYYQKIYHFLTDDPWTCWSSLILSQKLKRRNKDKLESRGYLTESDLCEQATDLQWDEKTKKAERRRFIDVQIRDFYTVISDFSQLVPEARRVVNSILDRTLCEYPTRMDLSEYTAGTSRLFQQVTNYILHKKKSLARKHALLMETYPDKVSYQPPYDIIDPKTRFQTFANMKCAEPQCWKCGVHNTSDPKLYYTHCMHGTRLGCKLVCAHCWFKWAGYEMEGLTRHQISMNMTRWMTTLLATTPHHDLLSCLDCKRQGEEDLTDPLLVSYFRRND